MKTRLSIQQDDLAENEDLKEMFTRWENSLESMGFELKNYPSGTYVYKDYPYDFILSIGDRVELSRIFKVRWVFFNPETLTREYELTTD